jgi:uncharacterized membrane protein YphA (DoxX/SURF4 family)
MSGIIEAITGMTEVIADNPPSILIVPGFIAILIGIFIPIGMGAQVLVGGLGLFMIIAGIIVHAIWLQD